MEKSIHMYFNKMREVIVRFISPIFFLFFFLFFENDALLVDFEYAIEFDIPFLFEYCSYFLVHICGLIIIVGSVLFWSQD